MPLFKKKEVKINEDFIPGWEDLPYCSLATEWGISTGLCENGDPKIKHTEALEFIQTNSLLFLHILGTKRRHETYISP